MYLAKINDSFMSGKNRKGSHWRIIDKDEKGKVYAVLTTHLFVPDNIRFKQIKDGQLIQVKFSCFDNPSVRTIPFFYYFQTYTFLLLDIRYLYNASDALKLLFFYKTLHFSRIKLIKLL